MSKPLLAVALILILVSIALEVIEHQFTAKATWFDFAFKFYLIWIVVTALAKKKPSS